MWCIYVATLFNPSTPSVRHVSHSKGSTAIEFLKCMRARSIFHGLLCVKIADLLISSLLTPQELITAKKKKNTESILDFQLICHLHSGTKCVHT